MQVMHDDNNITICTALYHALYQSFGFMSPAEGLHFSALVCLFVCLFVTGISTHLDATSLRLQHG